MTSTAFLYFGAIVTFISCVIFSMSLGDQSRNISQRFVRRIVDVPIILQLIRDLATYERAPNEVTATEEQLVDVLFGEKPAAEVLLAFEGEDAGRVRCFLSQFFDLARTARAFISKICS